MRNLFLTLDGMLPDKLNQVNRGGSPVYAVLLGFVISWFQFTVNVITPARPADLCHHHLVLGLIF